MSINLNDIVELDKTNMSSILEKVGNHYSPEKRLNSLKSEIEAGSVIFTDYKDNELAGYIQFMPKELGEIYVVSIQILPKYRNGVLLRQLLSKFKNALLQYNVSSITSSVHKANTASVRLHTIFNFQKTSCVNGVIKFRLCGEGINNVLGKLNKN